MTRQYVNDLESVLIQALHQFGIVAQRFAGHRGVWVASQDGLGKIAAVGVRIQKGGITSHGFALNVAPNIAHFDNIIPCGIQEYGVISMAQILQRPLRLPDLLPHIVAAFTDVFQVEAYISWKEPMLT